MKKHINFIMSAAIFLLLVLFVSLSFIYMFSIQTRSELKFGKNDMAFLEQDFAAAGYIDYISVENIMPAFVGVVSERGNVGAYSGEAKSALYRVCFSIAKKYLTSSRYDIADAEYAELLKVRAAENGCIYFKYAYSYPKSLIVNFSDRNTFSGQISDEYIKELFIFYDNTRASVIALAISGDGKNYVYTSDSEEDIGFNNRIAVEYANMEGTFDFRFAKDARILPMTDKESFEKAVYSYAVISEDAVVSSKINLGNSYEKLIENSATVLSTLTLNPEKAPVFTDVDGTKTFFEEGQNVVIDADGLIRYISIGLLPGIDIGEVIDYRPEVGGYSLRDRVGATLVIAERIFRATGVSDKAALRLSFVGGDAEGNLVVSYALTYSSIIVDTEQAVFTFTVSGEYIKKVTAAIPTIEEGADVSLPGALWSYTSYAMKESERADFIPAFTATYDGKYMLGYFKTKCAEVSE